MIPITIATVFYTPTKDVPDWSRCYTSEWVDRLYRGISRNYRLPFRFVALVDELYPFEEPIEQHMLKKPIVWARACSQLYGVDAPGKLVNIGLDTVITGPLDTLFDYQGKLIVPRDPYHPYRPCNAVVIMDGPRPDLVETPNTTDMSVLDAQNPDYFEDLYPRKVLSYKVHVRDNVWQNPSIVYFHGVPKQHEINEYWVKDAWN